MGLSFGFGWIGTVVCQVKELVLFPDINGVELFNEVDDLPIKVANFLTKFLREHQREGVRFMFRCVAGIHEGLEDHHGCILAGRSKCFFLAGCVLDPMGFCCIWPDHYSSWAVVIDVLSEQV